MAYADQTLVCRDCGQSFEFTASEQEFYASRGLMNSPSRCPSCRQARKAARGDTGGFASGGSSSGGGYSSGGYSSGGYSSGGYGRGGQGGDYERRPREMFTATCSSCGKEA